MPWAANSAPWAMHGRAPGDALGGRRGDPIGRPGRALAVTRSDELPHGIRTASMAPILGGVVILARIHIIRTNGRALPLTVLSKG